MAFMRSEREIILDNILSHSAEIHSMRVQARTIKEIAEFLGIEYNLFYKYLSRYTSIYNFRIYLKDLSIRLKKSSSKDKKESIKKENENNEKLEKEREIYINFNQMRNVDNERKQMVEDALFKACFDHTIEYKSFNKKLGTIEKIEQPVSANFNAQRFYLINRHPEKWTNENKEVVKKEDAKVAAIQVKFVRPNDEPNIKRVNEMMQELKDEYKN